jgi:CDGSH-type Zn-finger protein/uncharacterized Fe-S cluster protein YjdI
MHLLTPVACKLGTLPANPVLPEATAGLSFATLRSAAALLPDAVSIDLLVERIGEMSRHCTQIATAHGELDTLLRSTQDGLDRLASRLSRDAKRAGGEVAPTLAPIPATAAPQAPAGDAAPTPIPLGDGSEVIPGTHIDVVYSGQRCIHARHCVLALPGVFRANVEGPWIHPDATSVEQLVTIAQMCPSGAIRYRRHDGGAEEPAPPVNLIQIRENGPLGIRAQIVLDGEPAGMRAVLCRCGASKRKPYCDGSHNDAQFKATGEPDTVVSQPLAARGGPLRIDPETNGPLAVTGNLEICCGTGRTINRVTSVRLCRCGGSSNKPYCDDTHRRNGFRS